MYNFIQKLKKEEQHKNSHVISVPIKVITDEFPILDKIWIEYKGLVNYGTEFNKQTELLNTTINNNYILKEFRDEIMNYPDKSKYDNFEKYQIIDNKKFFPIKKEFNNVWHVRNGKYQHLIQDKSFPNYYWREQEMVELYNIGTDARGNFYYPPGGFREWHTNRIHVPGYRMYFVACVGDGESYFNYINPDTDEVVNLKDKNEYANIFEVNNDFNSAFWHSIYSEKHRFSLGFNITNIDAIN